MSWSVLAGGTALFYALHGAWSVRVSRHVGAVLAGWALFTFALPFLGAYLAFSGVPAVLPGFWPVWVLNSCLNLVAWSLFFSALKHGDLGMIYPLLALTPLMVLPVEWILLGELPEMGGAAGIGLIVAGVYLLNYRRGLGGPLEPLRVLLANRSAGMALAVAFIWSVAGALDRVAVLASSPPFYAFMLGAALSVLFVPLVVYTRRPGADRSPDERPEGGGITVLVVHGFLFACMIVLQMEALTMALASYVLAIKRSGAVVAVILGYLVYRESSLGPRLVGTFVTLAGTFVLVVWG